MLLLSGWNVQQSSSDTLGSSRVRMHFPLATSHSLAVPSNDVDRIMSFDKDHSKSENILKCTIKNSSRSY